ncbi:MAG: gliding motility-associated C-terminal domain-containing protein [Flavobacteriales bacterium]|nr:gliding motility-associated C-terminal domain-containing protein [Flavobacteriales bacterium]
MMKTRTLTAFLMAFSAVGLRAQYLPEFNMSDTVVSICKGILLDSEEGPNEMIYSNNEDYTFTINTGSTITLVFTNEFCTEQGLDLLTFHDGPGIGSPQIGPAYSGIVAPPPIIAYSGQLTVHFVTDANVAYCGFEAQWTTLVAPPVPPVMSIPVAPVCGSPTINLSFSYPLPCDSLFADAFSITGQGDPAVTGLQPLGCSGGSASQVQLTVDPGFDRNCPYTVNFRCRLPDACDSIWTFMLNANTQIISCPIDVTILATNDTICSGSCTELTADVNGCLSYTYAWTNGLPNSGGPVSACPGATTTYSVTVTEIATGITATDAITIVVIDPQITTSPMTVCQSLAAFDLIAAPPGGSWSGAGIIDTLAGTFDPDTAGPGTHTLYYVGAGGCADSIVIAVDSMDAGLPQAACPGTAPFYMLGFTPQGGTWSGPFVQANGLFDPSTVGSYIVTYSAGSCTDTTRINVDDIVGQAMLDTVCQSTWPFDIPVTPFGGRWSGPGITDTIMGTFDPDEAGGGTHILLYEMFGCDMSFTIHVKPIDIGDSRSACPAQSPYLLDPAAIPPGGFWNGNGIVDAAAGMYAPAQAGNGWDELTYSATNGCVDTIGILVGYTEVDDDTLFFCAGDDALILNENTTGRTPWDGVWTGTGVSQNSDGDWIFDPSVAGVGEYMLHFDANTCGDSLIAIVHPASLNLPDMSLCSETGPFLITSIPPGAVWSGDGIVDAAAGVFDPGSAGNGAHVIHYQAPAGCSDSLTITIYPFELAQITGVEEVYCGNDVQVIVGLFPPGGQFTGMNDTIFNPKSLAPGTYALIYSTGFGSCFSSDTLTFTNHPALTTEFTVSQNPVCDGGGSVLEVIPSAGLPGAMITFQWDNGLFPIGQQAVIPEFTTTYSVQTTDGCSDPVVNTVTIVVHPPFTPVFAYSDTACYGIPGFVQGTVNGQGTYSFTWDVDGGQSGPSIEAPAGELISVHVENDSTGCAQDTLLQVPSWPALTALFSINPSEQCIPFDESNVTFIDLSNNAIGGVWTIDTMIVPYVYGEDPQYDAGSAGSYPVQLTVFNIGGCVDSFALNVCIEPSTDIFIPDIFSPNGDGNNDQLFVRGGGIASMAFRIYDRWGGVVFEAGSNDQGWDGTSANGPAPSGVYVYTLLANMADGDVVELNGDITLVR